MPLSTGSIDSGFFGCDSGIKKASSDPSDQEDQKTTPLSMTDEDEMETTSSTTSGSSGFSATTPLTPSSGSLGRGSVFHLNSGFLPRKPRTRRSNRKPKQQSVNLGRFPRFTDTLSTSPTTSSCCLSVAGSSTSLSTSLSISPTSSTIDELALRLYFYFKSLLLAVNRQKTICESIGVLVKDFDARWGNSGVRRKACDPKGCLAPIYTSQRGDSSNLVQPARFPLCWAVPQPAIFYQLMANDVLEYLKFLERVVPNVKAHLQPNGPPIANEREAAGNIETLHKLQLQHHHHQQMARGMFPIFPPQIHHLDPSNRHMMKFHIAPRTDNNSSSSTNKASSSHRDSSTGSRGSSPADLASMKTILDGLDDEVTGGTGDMDKTPVVDEKSKKRESGE